MNGCFGHSPERSTAFAKIRPPPKSTVVCIAHFVANVLSVPAIAHLWSCLLQSVEVALANIDHLDFLLMTTSVHFRPHPGGDSVITSAPMLRAYTTVAGYQVEYGEIGLTKSGAWNRHCIDWVVRRMDFPNWTADKLYSVSKVLNEYDVPPLEYLRVLLTTLGLGRKIGGGWRLTKPGMALAGDPEAAYSKIAPAFLFRFDHTEGMRVGEAPAGDWGLWLNAINKMPEDDFTLPDLATFLYGPGWVGGWRGPAGGLFSGVAMPLEWVGLLIRAGDGGIDELLWRGNLDENCATIWMVIACRSVLRIAALGVARDAGLPGPRCWPRASRLR